MKLFRRKKRTSPPYPSRSAAPQDGYRYDAYANPLYPFSPLNPMNQQAQDVDVHVDGYPAEPDDQDRGTHSEDYGSNDDANTPSQPDPAPDYTSTPDTSADSYSSDTGTDYASDGGSSDTSTSSDSGSW